MAALTALLTPQRSPPPTAVLRLGSGVAWSRRADSQGQLFDTLEAAALHQPLKHSSQMAWRRLGSSTVAVAGGISAKASEMPPVGRFIFAPVESSRRQGANGIGQMVLGNPATARDRARERVASAREAAPRPGTTACAGQRGLAGRCRRSDGGWRGITRSLSLVARSCHRGVHRWLG